jgi:hypothetical protein
VLASATSLRFFSVTLTTRNGEYAELALKARAYQTIVQRRLRSGGALLALEVKNGRWHLHILAAVPARFEERKLYAWWLRLWPRGDDGPMSEGQYVRPVERRREEFFNVLVHHLRGPRRAEEKAMHPMAGRVLVAGVFSRPWLRLLPWVRGEVAQRPAPKREAPLGPPKVSAEPFPRLATPGETCAWCGVAFRLGTRVDCRFHNGCRQSAARALKMAVGFAGPRVRDWVHELEGWCLLRPDAVKLAIRLVRDLPWLTPGKLSRELGQRLFPRCHCGRPLAFRPDAKTCGRAFCRLKRPASEVVDLALTRQLQRLRQRLYHLPVAPEEPDWCRCSAPEFVETMRHPYCANCLLPLNPHPREVSS